MARLGRWMIALITVVSLAGIASPVHAQVVVQVGPRHHHHHHYRHHHHHYYR